MKLPGLFIRAATPVASVVIILAGIIQLRAQFWVAGAVCISLAMLGFIFSVRWQEKSPFTADEIESLQPYVLPTLLWLLIISLSIIAVSNVADNYKSPGTDRLAEVTWVSSVVLGLLATWWKPIRSDEKATFLERVKNNRLELLALLIVLVVAFSLRTIGLSAHPYPWSGDEASIGTEGMRILRGEVTNFFDTGWSLQANWSFVPTALSEAIFGNNFFALRLVSALIGTLAVLFVYLAGRELFNPHIGLLAAAFLATLPYHVHFSRLAVHNIMDSMMSALMFWLLGRAIRKDNVRYYYSAGVVAGLSIYTYAGTKLVLILAALTLLFLILRQKGFLQDHWKHLSWFAVAAAISAAPQGAFFVRHPDIFMGRFGQESILFNGWLAQQVAQTGKSALAILWQQFTRTTLVFIASPAPGNFFGSPYPYLTVFESILFLLGMGYALAYLLQSSTFILLVWFWAVIFFGGVLTLNPPANTRLLMTTPVIAMLMALGGYQLLEYLRKFKLIPQHMVTALLLLVVCLIAYQNISFYMFEYKENMYFQDANGEYAMEVGVMAKELGSDFQIVVLGEPRVFASFPTLAFAAPNNARADLSASNLATLQLAPGQKVGFFAIPENHLLLEEIMQKYPGGASGIFYRKPRPQEILFEYYILRP